MLNVLLGLLSSCSLVQDPAAATPEPTLPPNIVIVLVDDLGWGDLGEELVGIGGRSDHRTPHIAAFAKESLVMTNGYSAAPNCAPSRASLQTGRYTPRHGILTVGSSARGKAKHRELSRYRTRPCFRTGRSPWPSASPRRAIRPCTSANGTSAKTPHAGLRRQHRRNPPRPPEELLLALQESGPAGRSEGEYLTERLTDEAIAQMDELKRPFLMHLAYYTVHTPLQAPKARVEERRMAGAKSPRYAAMVEAMDAEFGRVLAALENKGLAENTVVLFTSDNGGYGPVTNRAPLRGFKGTLDEGGIRVPWIVRFPGHVAPGVTDISVHHVDVAPTLGALAGLAGPPKAPAPGATPGPALDGVDLTPLWLRRVVPEERLCSGTSPSISKARATVLITGGRRPAAPSALGI